MHLLLSLLLVAAVKDSGAQLKSSCEADASAVAELPGGTDLTIRFSLSGQRTPCYKVQAKLGTTVAEGYLPGDAITGLETFDKARKQGAALEVRDVLVAVGAPTASKTKGAKIDSLAEQAASLIESSQPGRALAMLEPELKRHSDPGLLALAGAAAWRADDPQRALELWKKSLAIQPNPQVQDLYERVERETQGDRSQQRIYGTKVLLRYEGTAISTAAAREMAAVVDAEYARISSQLGCTASERIVTIAQSKEAYQKTTAAAEWSGGQYDGRIRVPVFGSGASLDDNTRKTLAHETTHACLTMLGRWPAWLQEGVAQYMSGQTLQAADRDAIAAMARAGKLPSLAKLDGDWSGLSTANARVAYAVALRAVEIFQQDFSAYGLRNLLRNPEQLPRYAAEIDKRLGI
jgi:hypothetical protein